MATSKGECQLCKKTLGPTDDVVICPDCGAPYHRECFQKNGKCVYESRHGGGFEYKPSGAIQTAAGEKGAVCPQCGTVNSRENLFCESCGRPLGRAAPPRLSTVPPGAGEMPGEGTQPLFGGTPFSYSAPFASLEGEIDGIPKEEWATFIGRSHAAYIPKLSLQQVRGSKIAFSFSAFLFPSMYFAYRKLWKWSALAFLSLLLLLVPSALALLGEVGVLPGMPVDALRVAGNITSYVNLASRMLFSLFSLHLYRQDAVKKIRALKEKKLESADYAAALSRAGGVNVVGPILVAAVFIGLYVWFYIVGGEAIMAQYYPDLVQQMNTALGSSSV